MSLCPLPLGQGALSDDACLTSDGPKLRTERPRKTKTGTEVAHVTHKSDTTFKVNCELEGLGYVVAASRTACYTIG